MLFGFLGFSNFIFFINPKDGGYWEDAYYIINTVMQSSQVRKLLKFAKLILRFILIMSIKYYKYIEFLRCFLLQGIVVSILYCFMSADVRMALKKRYYRQKVRYQSRRMQNRTRVTTKVFNQG